MVLNGIFCKYLIHTVVVNLLFYTFMEMLLVVDELLRILSKMLSIVTNLRYFNLVR